MLDTLIALTDTGEFEYSGGFRFNLARSTANCLELELFLNPGDETAEQLWRIDCIGVREHFLRGEFDGLRIASSHPVLLPHTDEVSDLHFYSASTNPKATLGALYERHRELVGTWISFDRFLNPMGLSQLLATSCGQLASGPVTLMIAYSKVLNEQGIRSSLMPSRPSQFLDGEKWAIRSVPLEALIFESSYVVAERFEARRLNSFCET